MKKTVITLAAALLLGTSWTALAQEQDPTLIIPDGAGQQGGQAPEQKSEKKRKKREAEQPSAEQQFEQPQPEKKKRRKQAEQPDDSMQQPSGEQQFEQPQPEKKRKKKQAQQPEEQFQQPVEEQLQQEPVKKRKKKQQAEQPEEQTQQPAEEQLQQEPVKKKKKKQAEEPVQQQPTDQQVEQPVEQPTGQQAEQPQPENKKRKKEQAEQPAEQQPSTPEQTTGESKTPATGGVPADVSQYLSDTRPASELSDAELSQRIKAGRSLSKTKGLPDDVRQELAGKAKQARTEAIARERGGGRAGQQPESGQQTTEQPTGQKPEQTTGESKPGTSDQAGVPPEVSQYLSDTRPASELSDAELAERVKAGRTLSRTKGLSDDVRKELAGKAKQARTEALAREQGKGGKQPEPGQQPTAEQPSGEQQPTAEKPVGEQPVIADPKKNAEGQEVVPIDQPGQPTVTLDKKDVEKFDSNKSTPQAEAKAKSYLDDNRRGDQLKDDEAKARLDGMRDLLSDNELSRETKRELRRRLKEERDLYRRRVAEKVIVEETKDEQRDRFPRRRDREEDRRWDNWAERDILRDRRRSDELEEGELRRRIDIYREAIYDDRYSDDERAYWRDMMDRDRRYLGDRMRYDRDERERYWRDRRDRNEINIAINIDLSGDREPPPSAFLDEIDDEELEDYLVTAPRRKVARRYTVAEIEEEPEVRTAMPAIEIDNIHFGFNEAFLREEEVQNLDRVAEVVEKILAAHPGEVFMIEGHTDAVGSEAYNLKLSRERAQAVKKALTTYYAIEPRNLVTAGYGERYLKIPTAEPEEENRRVSFRRVTPLVGEAE
ncbi:MAG: OmpA family protein [Pseudomonadota bacterium]